jgi:hypothetical protein
MLQLLPALLLLILQGPSNVERLAVEGAGLRVQGAGCRIQHPSFKGQSSGIRVQGARCQALVASLLAASGHPELSQALIELLQAATNPEDAELPNPPILQSSNPVERPPCIGRPSAGFLLSQRSRDGPAVG